MDTDSDWERLASLVADRRTDLGITQVELAQSSGLSLDRISAIERGRARSLRPSTMRALETGLLWERGSVRAVLAGGDPVPLPDATKVHEETTAEILAETDEIADEVMAMLARRGLTASDRQRKVAEAWAESLEKTLREFEDESDAS